MLDDSSLEGYTQPIWLMAQLSVHAHANHFSDWLWCSKALMASLAGTVVAVSALSFQFPLRDVLYPFFIIKILDWDGFILNVIGFILRKGEGKCRSLTPVLPHSFFGHPVTVVKLEQVLPWKPWDKSCSKRNDNSKMPSKVQWDLRVSLVRRWRICTWILIACKHNWLFFLFVCLFWWFFGNLAVKIVKLCFYVVYEFLPVRRKWRNLSLDLPRFLCVRVAKFCLPNNLYMQESDASHEQSAVWAQRINMLIFTKC